MQWVIVANTNSCKIYSYEKHKKKLTLVEEIISSLSKAKTSEIATDRPGHYKTQLATRGTYAPRTDPKEVEIEKFAHEIAENLNAARKKQQFNNLVIISSPHMMGLINKSLDDLAKAKSVEITKDYTKFDEGELLANLAKIIF